VTRGAPECDSGCTGVWLGVHLSVIRGAPECDSGCTWVWLGVHRSVTRGAAHMLKTVIWSTTRGMETDAHCPFVTIMSLIAKLPGTAFVIGCRPVLISSAVRLWTHRNSAAVFLVRCDDYFRLFARHKTWLRSAVLHCGKHVNGNRKQGERKF